VASRAAISAAKAGLAMMIDAIGGVHRAGLDKKLDALLELVQVLPIYKAFIEPWILIEIASKTAGWIEDLESALYNGRNAAVLLNVIPPFLEVLDVPDREARMQRLRQKAAALLIKDKQYKAALVALEKLSERQPKLEAACHEGLGDFRRAAEAHLAAGNSKEALNSYRSIPDTEAALKLATEIGHPAADALQWISTLRGVVAQRPDKFTKSVTPAEKKALEQLLEEALGVTRKKPAPRKAPAVRKAAPKKAPKKTAPVKRVLKKDWPKPGEYF
jgi:tetratricopeptide (TPR) repeat protein